MFFFCKIEKIGKYILLVDDSIDEVGSGCLYCMRNGSFRKLFIILFLWWIWCIKIWKVIKV